MLDDEQGQFDEITKAMCHDISAAIRGEANYLAALGLLEYSEILGGWVRGTMGKPKQGKENFDEFYKVLSTVNTAYGGLKEELKNKLRHLDEKWRTVYSAVRSGLSHYYFMQAKSTIVNNPDDSEGEMIYDPPCGLYFRGEFLIMNTNQYFHDFRLAIAKLSSEG